MLVVFFRVKNSDFGIFKGLLENGSHFPQNSPQNCNLGIFRGLKSKSGYFRAFQKFSDEHTYHFYIKINMMKKTWKETSLD